MATVKKRGESWLVRWKELEVVRGEDGVDRRIWKDKGRSFPTEKSARTFAAEREVAASRGEKFVDAREQPVVTVETVGLAYVKAAVDAGVPLATQRHRSAMIGSLLDFCGRRAASDLSITLLEEYAQSLPSRGRQASTRHRKVLAAEQMWRWAHDRPERFPGVPVPRRYTGTSSESDKLQAPPPVVAVAAPTWADVDAVREHLLIEWHRRAVLVARYTGLRASQVCGLSWEDIDLDRGILRVRARVRGSKKGRARVVPLHPALVAEMATWGVREGILFPRRYKAKDGSTRTEPYRGDALVEPLRRAWTAAQVPRDRWDVPDGDDEDGRAKGSPTHALRRCVRTELLRAGVEEAIVLYLVGQSQGVTAAAYVPEASPEQSPYWPRMVDAVTRIPDHRQQNVVRMSARR